jgi:hypothetical protein
MNAVRDRIQLATLLGLRFVDVGTGEVVRSGLAIEIYDPARPDRRSHAQAVGSGCWVPFDLAALGLPNLGEAERNGIGSAAWTSLVQRALRLRIEVTDSTRRFLPSRFELPLPSAVTAAAARFEDSLPIPLRLYSAPWRQPSADLLALRAELLDRASGSPLAGACASVHLDVAAAPNPPVLASGVADAKGHLLLVLRQPTRTAAPPPGGGAANGGGALWPTSLRLALRHRALPADADAAWTDVPEREAQAVLQARQGLAVAAVAATDDLPLAPIALTRGAPRALRTTRLGVDAHGQPTRTTLPSLLVTAP